MKIEVYADGSATTKDMPGGYGWVIIIDGKFYSEGSGSIPNATNNDAELEAAIMGLGNAWRLGQHGVPFVSGDVFLVSDSEIVLGWLSGKYRFKQESKRSKYDALMRLKKAMNVTGRWVEGHTGDQWNERCDKLAGIERRKAMGIEPKKKELSKSTLLLQKIKEIANIASSDYITKDPEDLLRDIRQLCEPFLGSK